MQHCLWTGCGNALLYSWLCAGSLEIIWSRLAYHSGIRSHNLANVFAVGSLFWWFSPSRGVFVSCCWFVAFCVSFRPTILQAIWLSSFKGRLPMALLFWQSTLHPDDQMRYPLADNAFVFAFFYDLFYGVPYSISCSALLCWGTLHSFLLAGLEFSLVPSDFRRRERSVRLPH